MDRTKIISSINAFLVEDFEVEESALLPEAPLKETLDLDSLDYIDLVVAIEQAFHFKVAPEDFTTMRTLQDFYVYVENRLRKSAATA